jgi:hypothetical protein
VKRAFNIFNLPTKKTALNAFVCDGNIHVIVNERVFNGSETYLITFDAEELINWKLKKIYEAMKHEK